MADQSSGIKDIVIGLIVCIAGIALTVAEIGYIFYGAIIFGAIQFFKGIYIVATSGGSKRRFTDEQIQAMVDEIGDAAGATKNTNATTPPPLPNEETGGSTATPPPLPKEESASTPPPIPSSDNPVRPEVNKDSGSPIQRF